MQPYEPPEGQLITLQLRLLLHAQAFLDSDCSPARSPRRMQPELLRERCVLSPAYATGRDRQLPLSLARPGL